MPTPPTPVRVTSRWRRTSSIELGERCRSRPMRLVRRHRQVAAVRVAGARRRELRRRAVDDDLEQALGPRQVGQPVVAEVDEVDTVEQRRRPRADEDLPPVRRRHDARGAVRHRTEVAPVALAGRAGLEPHPRPQPHVAGPGLGGQGALRGDRGIDRVLGIRRTPPRTRRRQRRTPARRGRRKRSRRSSSWRASAASISAAWSSHSIVTPSTSVNRNVAWSGDALGTTRSGCHRSPPGTGRWIRPRGPARDRATYGPRLVDGRAVEDRLVERLLLMCPCSRDLRPCRLHPCPARLGTIEEADP